jgi:hypothetical protein
MEAAGLVLVAAFIEKLVEKLRNQFPVLDGWYVNACAYALGLVVAFGFSLEVFNELGFSGPAWLDRLLTGFGLGAGSGFLADFSGRSGPRAEVPMVGLAYTLGDDS